MDNVTSLATQVNNIVSVLGQKSTTTYNSERKRIPHDLYTAAKSEHYKLADEIIKKHGYKGSKQIILKEMVRLYSPSGPATYGQEFLAQQTGYSKRTVSDAYKQYVADGIVSYTERPGWNIGKRKEDCTNITVLLFLKTKLPVVDEETSHNINNLTYLGDLITKQTYDEYVTLSANTQKKQDIPKPAPKPISKHISLAKLNGQDPDGEVIRVCLAWLLTESQTKTAVLRMRKREGMNNPATYLVGMIKLMLAGKWESDKPESKHVSTPPVMLSPTIETELREKAELMASDALAKAGLHESAIFDPRDPWRAQHARASKVILNKLTKDYIDGMVAKNAN